MTKREIAAHFGVSTSTIDRRTRAGMPCTQPVGGHRRYDAEACDAWHANEATMNALPPPEQWRRRYSEVADLMAASIVNRVEAQLRPALAVILADVIRATGETAADAAEAFHAALERLIEPGT